MVLRRRAQQRRPADVDHLDDFRVLEPEPAGDALERIEVDADELERLDAVLGERSHVARHLAPGEDPRVDARVQRLDAPVEHLREAGEVLHALDAEARILQLGGGTSARDEPEAQLGEPARERHEPGLVVNGEERSHLDPFLH